MRRPTLLLTALALAGATTAQQQCTADVQPLHHLRLRAAVDGRVATIAVQVGQQVQAGDVLLTLDNQELRAALVAAQAALEQATHAVAATKIDREIAEQQLTISERDLKIASEGLPARQETLKAAEGQFANLEVLYEAGRVQIGAMQQARIEVARAKEEWHTSGERVKSLQQQVAIAQLRVKRAELDQLIAASRRTEVQAGLDVARRNLDEASLRAPFAGTVARVPVAPGQLVDARATVAVELLDLSRVRLRFTLPALASRGLAVGQEVEVAFAAQRLAARIASVDPFVDPVTGTRGAELVVDNPDGAWLPGTTTNVSLPRQ